MGCRRYRKQLSGAAAGTLEAPGQRALEEHLARCAGCAARFARLKRSIAAVERALAESAAAEPSAELLAGLERRLAGEGEAGRPRSFGRAMAVAAIAAAVVVAAWMVHGRPPASVPQAGSVVPSGAERGAAVGTAGQLAAGASFPARNRSGARPVAARIAPPPPREKPAAERSDLAEAKIPPEQGALISLMELVRSGKVDPQSLLPAPETKIQPIVIKPLEIEPLSIPPLEIGDKASPSKAISPGQGSSTPTPAGAN